MAPLVYPNLCDWKATRAVLHVPREAEGEQNGTDGHSKTTAKHALHSLDGHCESSQYQKNKLQKLQFELAMVKHCVSRLRTNPLGDTSPPPPTQYPNTVKNT